MKVQNIVDMKREILLQPLNADNWEACTNLKLLDSQQDALPSNMYSIAELQFYPQTKAYAITYGDGIVGFTTCGIPADGGSPKIFRLMIGKDFQGRGYGKSALRKVITLLFDKSESNEIQVCYHPNMKELKKFYSSVGFKEKEILLSSRRAEGKMLATLQREDFFEE